MGLSALERYRFDAYGYVVLPDVLDATEVETLRKAIAAADLPEPGEDVMQQRFGLHGELFGWHPAFRDLIDHPVVLGVLADLIGPHARLDHAYGIMMRAGNAGFGLHGPGTTFDPSQFYVYRNGRMHSGLLVFSWALTSGVIGEGGFGCVPASHRAEEPLPREPEAREALTVEVPQPAGSLVVFTEALTHCTIPWRAAENRLSLLYKYSPGNSSWSPQPAVPPEARHLLTDRQRRLVEPPYVGGRRPSLDQ